MGGEDDVRDVFVSHASEDKDEVARPLAQELASRGLDVWYDEFSLVVGESLRREIDRGLRVSRFGVVILSNHFFNKEWPQRELDALTARETGGTAGIILPVWHNVDRRAVAQYSLVLADRVAVSSALGIPRVADRIVEAIRRGNERSATRSALQKADLRRSVSPKPGDAELASDRFRRATRAAESSTTSVRLEWHPEVHAACGRSELIFLRMEFQPRLNRQDFLLGLGGVLLRSGVTALVVDELFGAEACMLRAWIPRSVVIADWVQEVFAFAPNAVAVDHFRVREVVRHWLWHGSGSSLLRPAPDALAELSSDWADALAGERMSEEEEERVLSAHLAARTRPSAGQRFYVMLRWSRSVHLSWAQPVAEDVSRPVEEKVIQVVDHATGIDEPALYLGDRSNWWFALIVGKVTTHQLNRLQSDLLDPLKEAMSPFDVIVKTTIAASPDALWYQDEVRPRGAGPLNLSM